MYSYSKKSGRKVVHKDNCYHLREAQREAIGWFHTLEEAQAAGYRLCRHCDRAIREYRNEEKQIEQFCAQNEIKCYTQNEKVIIVTPYSKWKIIFVSKRMFLYHKNSQKRLSDMDSIVPGYHSQAIHKDTIIEYLKYVIEHDQYRLLHDMPVRNETTKLIKGTKKYKKAMKRQKKREHRYEVKRVLDLIESLSEYDVTGSRQSGQTPLHCVTCLDDNGRNCNFL